MSGTETGTLFGVGVGPGDPELLTLKAARVLAEVDWIFHPAGPRSSFAQRIIAPLNLPVSKFRKVELCMSRARASDRDTYARTAVEIVDELRHGKSAAWIAEGDPLFYSTFAYVRAAVQQLLPAARIEIIPGVTSMQAAAARAGVPLACLDERVAVVPAAYGIDALPALLDEFATVVLLKVHSVFDTLLDRLANLSVSAVYLEMVGTPEERIVTDLHTLRGQALPYFSLVILRSASVAPSKEAR